MMSHPSSPSRIVVVWLVLVALLCCLLVPSVALAKKERTIATEGDPDDGLDSTGGGNGKIEQDANLQSEIIVWDIYPSEYWISYIGPWGQIGVVFWIGSNSEWTFGLSNYEISSKGAFQ